MVVFLLFLSCIDKIPISQGIHAPIKAVRFQIFDDMELSFLVEKKILFHEKLMYYSAS